MTRENRLELCFRRNFDLSPTFRRIFEWW